MQSEPPSLVPPTSGPFEPDSAAYRSSSAPTTSLAPPPAKPGLGWPILRIGLAACMLILATQAAVSQDPDSRGLLVNAWLSAGLPLLIASLPLVFARYRSVRLFSWLLLVAAFFQLYVHKDGVLGVSPAVGRASDSFHAPRA